MPWHPDEITTQRLEWRSDQINAGWFNSGISGAIRHPAGQNGISHEADCEIRIPSCKRIDARYARQDVREPLTPKVTPVPAGTWGRGPPGGRGGGRGRGRAAGAARDRG